MKDKKGITLVALIITIIVMVILAGVIIASAVAEGGVIDRAQEAMKEKERAEVEELIIASYIYKTGASSGNVYAYLDLNQTAKGIWDNLTNNGFILKDSTGNEYQDKDKFLDDQEGSDGKIDEIDINAEGKHGEYEGTVTDKGLEDDLEVKGENTNTSEIPENEEKFEFTLAELANYQNDDPPPGRLETSRNTAIIMFPLTLSEELIFGTPHPTQEGYWINNITCSDSEYSIIDATCATSDPGLNFFQFVNAHETIYADSVPYYGARLILYINGTLITKDNYEPYADLKFTITK